MATHDEHATPQLNPIRVLVLPGNVDYQVVLDNAGSGMTFATCDKPAAAVALAALLRDQEQAVLADLWERA